MNRIQELGRGVDCNLDSNIHAPAVFRWSAIYLVDKDDDFNQ